MSRVYVAHLEASAVAGKTTGSKGRETALVGDLRERIGLVHELRELRRAEELLHYRRHRLVVDQVLRNEGVDVLHAHALLHGALHADETDAVLVLDQLADRTHTAVAEVVDVVDRVALSVRRVAELKQVANRLLDVLWRENALVHRRSLAALGDV